MWLIAETVDGIYLEYWAKGALKPALSLPTEANAATDLDIAKFELNLRKVKPPEIVSV
jgi:hypothetical protein